MARLFFALDLTPQDKAEIHQLQRSITPTLPKPTAPENLHLTLAFLGNISEQTIDKLCATAEQLAKNLITHSPYQLTGSHLGVFEKANVLFIGLTETPNWLDSLASALEHAAKTMNIRMENRAYHPHITLSRKVKQLPDPIHFKLSLSITSFSLYLSESTAHGVVYTPLKTFTLCY